MSTTAKTTKAFLPTVHLNGTGRETLFREYQSAYRAIREAREKFASTTCHARDYYVQPAVDGQSPYCFARVQRDEILDKYQEIEDFLSQFVTHLHPDLN